MLNVRLLIGIPTHSGYVTRCDFYDYITDLQKPDGCMVMQVCDRSPARARNDIFQEALNRNRSHVLFVDNDMAPKPDALLQLLEHDVDIVSGLYLSGNYPHQPICFDAALDNGRYVHTVLRGGEERLREVAGVGFGFLLVKTAILTKHLGVDFKTVRKWIETGLLTAYQFPPQPYGEIRIRKTDAVLFVEQARVRPPTDGR